MKTKQLLNRLKFNAFKLKERGCIPPLLFSDVCSLDHTSSIEDIKCYMFVCEHLMRLKGFYHRYVFDEETVRKQIEDLKEVWKGKV